MAKIQILYPNAYLALRTRIRFLIYLKNWAERYNQIYCEHYETNGSKCISILEFKDAGSLNFFLLTADLSSIPTAYHGPMSLTNITVIPND